MGIRVSRHSHTTGQWRMWGSGQVEVFPTAMGVALEFTRRVGRGSTTFQIEFDDDGCHELASVIRARRKTMQGHRSRPLPSGANPRSGDDPTHLRH
jgi:hypothetical protein